MTGDPQVGKTAFLNRAVDFLVNELRGRGLWCEVLDLASVLAGLGPMAVAERISVVLDALVTELRLRGRLGDKADEVDRALGYPDRVFRVLGAVPQQDVVLAVLLSRVELAAEVVRYVGLLQSRCVVFMESHLLDDHELDTIGTRPGRWARRWSSG